MQREYIPQRFYSCLDLMPRFPFCFFLSFWSEEKMFLSPAYPAGEYFNSSGLRSLDASGKFY